MSNDIYTIALFGEAEKGEFKTAYYCSSLADLDEYFGNPPVQSRGLHYAVQALLFKRSLIYFRVVEEGFSIEDYLTGIKMLEVQQRIPHINAFCVPGVGDQQIINALLPVCTMHKGIIITNQTDFYDYLTSFPQNVNY